MLHQYNKEHVVIKNRGYREDIGKWSEPLAVQTLGFVSKRLFVTDSADPVYSLLWNAYNYQERFFIQKQTKGKTDGLPWEITFSLDEILWR